LLHPVSRVRARTALVASADRSFRQRIGEILTGLRWQVREVEGGAQAWTEAELAAPEAVISQFAQSARRKGVPGNLSIPGEQPAAQRVAHALDGSPRAAKKPGGASSQ
jgi:hypothetical protein